MKNELRTVISSKSYAVTAGSGLDYHDMFVLAVVAVIVVVVVVDVVVVDVVFVVVLVVCRPDHLWC